MTKRLCCALAVLTALLLGGHADAQQEGHSARIGLVSLHSEELATHVDGIRKELQRLGYTDHSAIKIDAHFTNGDKQRAGKILKAFVDSRVDIIVPWTTPTVQLAKEATQTIPIVMIASDPVAAGLVPSLSRPGGNITGVSMSGPDLAGKAARVFAGNQAGYQNDCISWLCPQSRGSSVRP